VRGSIQIHLFWENPVNLNRFIIMLVFFIIMFCSKCKCLMKPKKTDSKVVMFCDSCNISSDSVSGVSSEKFDFVKKEVEIADDTNVFATENHVCKKCGHNKAQLIEKGAFYSDEETAILFRCGKCGHTELVTKPTG